MKKKIIILDVCAKELKKFPVELQKDLLMITEQLLNSVSLTTPDVRKVST